MTDRGIQIDDVTVRFPTPGGEPVTAVDRVTQRIPERSFVSVVGPSGCGKSTLLGVVTGLDRRVGLVFQEDSTLPWKTVTDNVRFAMQIAGVERSEQRRRAREAIELVGLTGFESAHPSMLSGGMRQRVALARSLALEPSVLLMDEPFAALDQQTRLLLGAEILRIWRRTHQTVLFVTHDLSEAILLSQQVWVMSYRPGRIIDVVDIDLPADRDASVVSTPEFNRLQNRVWESLRAESLRGFRQESEVGA